MTARSLLLALCLALAVSFAASLLGRVCGNARAPQHVAQIQRETAAKRYQRTARDSDERTTGTWTTYAAEDGSSVTITQNSHGDIRLYVPAPTEFRPFTPPSPWDDDTTGAAR